MKKIQVPFEAAEDRGTVITIELPYSVDLKEYRREEPAGIQDLAKAVVDAVEAPVGGKKFSELIAGGGKKVLFMIENQFRAAMADTILPTLVDMAEAAGCTCKIAIGSGKVGALNEDEVRAKIGDYLYEKKIPVTSNDPQNNDAYTFMGITSHGIPCWVLNWVAEADVKVTIGTTQATLWGYGGSGMVLPGTAHNDSIEMNHIFSLSPDCLPGNNECIMQQDKYEMLRLCDITMGINVIVSNQFEIIDINAGDPVESHKASVARYDKLYAFDITEEDEADIVIVGSTAPTDHLFFHTGWAIVNADPVTKKDGTIVFSTPVPGYGPFAGFALMDLMADYMPPTPENNEKALRDFAKQLKELWAGCIWYPIYREMVYRRCEFVTLEQNLEDARKLGLDIVGPTEMQAKVDKLIEKYGPDCKVAFVPFGRYTVLRK